MLSIYFYDAVFSPFLNMNHSFYFSLMPDSEIQKALSCTEVEVVSVESLMYVRKKLENMCVCVY